MSKRIIPTVAELHGLFSYDPASGILRWRHRVAVRSPGGAIAGGPDNKGYICVSIRHFPYKVHRIAWGLMTGEWPTSDIDHINGNHGDNRWENLREVTRTVNSQNMKRARKGNTTGLLGVSRDRRRYRAQIRIAGRPTFLGLFDTAEEAHAVYLAAKRVHHPGNTL